jgi:hypothetical protein
MASLIQKLSRPNTCFRMGNLEFIKKIQSTHNNTSTLVFIIRKISLHITSIVHVSYKKHHKGLIQLDYKYILRFLSQL